MKLKVLAIVIFFFLPFLMSGQDEYGVNGYLLLSRQPSARSEAMGRGYASFGGDLSSVYFNPAGISTIPGLEVDIATASPYYLLEDAHFYFASAGFKISKYLAFATTVHEFSIPDITFMDADGNFTEHVHFRATDYKLTLASEPLDHFYVGLNFNLSTMTPQDLTQTSNVGYFDIGLLKEFLVAKTEKTKQSIQVGGSVVNVNSASMDYESSGGGGSQDLPVVSRLGAHYSFMFNPSRPDSLHWLECIVQTEVEDLLNSKYLTSLKGGLEIKVLELIALRAGYYTQKLHDFYIPGENYARISDFTYGIGLELPLEKLTHHKFPMNIYFDYTSLPQVKYSDADLPSYFDPIGNFTSMNMRITWNPWNK